MEGRLQKGCDKTEGKGCSGSGEEKGDAREICFPGPQQEGGEHSQEEDPPPYTHRGLSRKDSKQLP